MKIGIITLNSYENYGNRLQNYALQKILENMIPNGDVESIWLKENKIDKMSNKEAISKLRKFMFNRHGYKDYINNRVYANKYIREYNIRKFSKENIHERIIYNTKELLGEYDVFVWGSDQIWNPYAIDEYEAFLIEEIRNKSISYAASFGVKEIPLGLKETFKIFLDEILHISVREQAGANIVKELTDKNVPVLIDPTFLIEKKEWCELSQRPWWLDDKNYILVFFLLGLTENTKNFINKVAEENNLLIINILDESNVDHFTASPEEFIYLISHARLVFTDSFHATVFSIIMGTPFINYSRKDRDVNSRIDTLLEKFSMEDRHIMSESEFKVDLFNMDFRNVDNVINKEKKNAISFLKNALNL